MIEFICATYNEENEIEDLLEHVSPYVDWSNIVDDGSLDNTFMKLRLLAKKFDLRYDIINHTGLPETVKNHALQMVGDGAWVIMLDADERFAKGVLSSIKDFCNSNTDVDYVYSPQIEVIDGQAVREFQKCKVFRKEAITFPLHNIHADDQFRGNGIFRPDWQVIHRKSSSKQRVREKEYLDTYRRLLDEGHIDQGRYEWLVNLHHYER